MPAGSASRPRRRRPRRRRGGDRGPEPAPPARGAGRIRLDLRVALGDSTVLHRARARHAARGIDAARGGPGRACGTRARSARSAAPTSLRTEARHRARRAQLPGADRQPRTQRPRATQGARGGGGSRDPRERVAAKRAAVFLARRAEPEKLAWLVLGRGQGEVAAADAARCSAAGAILGRRHAGTGKILGGLGSPKEHRAGGQRASWAPCRRARWPGDGGTTPPTWYPSAGGSPTTSTFPTARASRTPKGRCASPGSTKRAGVHPARRLPEGIDAVYRFSFR